MRSDRNLVSSVLEGTVNDFTLLVDRYQRPVYGFVLQRIRNPHLAEEITQEVFVRAYEKLGTLYNPTAFGAWLFTIARHEVLRVIKTNQRTETLGEAQQPRVEPEHESLDDERALFDALSKLSRNEQKAIYLKHFGGYSIKEIAAMNGSPAGTISKRLSRAYARLRGWLQEIEP